MMNTYTELLEQIIAEMKAAFHGGSATVIDSDYRQWLDFLRQVHPESKLLKDGNSQPKTTIPNDSEDQTDVGIKVYTDLREIIRLAATYDHPTWYIQPHFTGSPAQFTYENEELKNALAINGVPKTIEKFNGTVHGVWLDEQTFVACDTDNKDDFAQKMEFLKQAGFTTPDFVLFPTDKLLTISVSKLEESLMNFISIAQKSWAKVDGVTIISGTPLFSDNGGVSNNRIIFKPNNLLLKL